jgi:acid phosphatase type 7
VLLAAGDIAGCTWTGDETTAALVNALPGTIVTLGDNVYPNGTASEFANCYAPSWGQFKARTRPTPGNHDYNTAGASGYFDYFNGVGAQTGPAGNRALGYYSFDVGSWHIVVLNSECEATTGLWLKNGCAAGSDQEIWLKTDLANAPTNNIIVTWHKPRFSSSTEHGNSSHMQALWQAAYTGGADLVLSGHAHNYERFAPMSATGALNTANGMREIVVGTGGAGPHGFTTPAATSEVRATGTYGVLKLTLHASSYDWQFVPVAGQSFTDSGTQAVTGPRP